VTPPRCLPPERPALLSFRGPDAVRFLNGQLTRDVADIGDETRLSCVTDAKGRLQFTVEVCAGTREDELWVILPESQPGEGLRERLERYLIADEVEVEEVDARWTRVRAGSARADAGADFTRSARGVFPEGVDHWWRDGGLPDWPPLAPEEIDRLRIEAGIPTWGRELEQGMLPPEAGFDRHAISYEKGCYIGQEVLSRIKSIGRVNRRLARFELDRPATAGEALHLDDNEIGRLTSVAGTLALGYLGKKGYDASEFRADSGATARRLDWA